MTTTDFTTSFSVGQTPKQVFDAVNNPRAWWSEEIQGDTNKPGAEFDYHYEDLHRCKIKITELVPSRKVVWQVLENYFQFTKDKMEWTDTKIVFEIAERDDKTHLRFTHVGLIPQYECYEICRDAWTTYVQQSLRNLISTGTGQPNGKGKPQTENEKKIASSH